MNVKFKYNYPKLPFLKIIFSILLGLICTIYLAQEQTNLKKIIYQKAKTFFENSLNCTVDFKIDQINLFTARFKIKDLVIKPKQTNAAWSWGAKSVNFKFTWLYLLVNQKINAQITLNKLFLNSQYQNHQLAISDHLYQLLFTPSQLPIEIKSFELKSAQLNIINQTQNLVGSLNWSSKSKLIANNLKTSIYFKTGQISTNNAIYLDQLSGNIQINLPLNMPQHFTCYGDIDFNAPILNQDNRYFIHGKWDHHAGHIKLGSMDGSLELEQIDLKLNNEDLLIKAKGVWALESLQKINTKFVLPKISGYALIDLSAQICPEKHLINGNFILNKPTINHFLICDQLKLDFIFKDQAWSGNINFIKEHSIVLFGKWQWQNQIKTGNCEFHNPSQINLPINNDLALIPNQTILKLDLACPEHNLIINGYYQSKIINLKTDFYKELSGNFKYMAPELLLDGYLNHHNLTKQLNADHFKAIFNLDLLTLNQLIIFSGENHQPYIEIKSQDQELQTSLDLELIKQRFTEKIDKLFTGHGKLLIKSKLIDHQIHHKLSLLDANIILPQIYNMIKACDGEIIFDLNTHALQIKNLNLNLHKGQIKITQGLISSEYVYLPFLINSLALNFERKLIMQLSGKLLYQKHLNHHSDLSGFILSEKALCRYNLFSPEFGNLFNTKNTSFFADSIDPQLKIQLITKTPAKIKSEFLETAIHSNLALQGALSQPKLIGQTNIIGGKINFPYKPLYIKYGHIHASDTHYESPVIDLVAKNQIKRHDITMHVSGTLNDPYMILEAFPSLTEEQIGTLLLLGTENTALNMIMPAIITQNINNILFGSIHQEEQTNSLIRNFFKPLDHVKFVPSFSDETGRGGLKGAVTIDVNDRLHALIQKNFSLTEDTKLEIDYAITDNISVRCIKDERGDLGGEFEFRLKI